MPAHFRAVENAMESVKKVKQYIDNGLDVTLDVALDLEEVSQDCEQVKELEDTMLQYIDMEREVDQWAKAVELAKAEFNRQYDVARWVGLDANFKVVCGDIAIPKLMHNNIKDRRTTLFSCVCSSSILFLV